MLGAWLSLLVRSGLILAAAEVLRRLSSRSPAAHRHRFIAAAFALLFLWPMISAMLPEVPVPVWHEQTNAIVTVTQSARFLTAAASSAANINWPLSLWALGALLALLPILLAHLRIHRLLANASPLIDDDWTELMAAECARIGLRRHPGLLICDAPAAPLTCGIIQPRILLPSDSLNWPALRRRAVLMHELMHVHRRDLPWQLFAHLTSALWWFQPLCWQSRRSLQQESEEACDAWVVLSGVRASDYAAELLEISKQNKTAWTSVPAAIAMTHANGLECRLNAILTSRPREARGFPAFRMLALVAVTVLVSAVTSSSHESTFQGGHPMKRTLISGLLTSAGLTAATIGGSVFDPSGAVIPNAHALLINPDSGIKQQVATTAEGKFSFQSLPSGSYILQIDKPGFATLYREFTVQPDSEVERGLVLKAATGNANGNDALVPLAQSLQQHETATSTEPAGSARLLRVGGQVAQSNLITKVQPIYPASAKAARLQGTVELEVAISKEGVPEDIRVISSPGDDLTQSALEAVRQWRYRPTLLNGEPIAIVTDVIVTYTLMP